MRVDIRGAGSANIRWPSAAPGVSSSARVGWDILLTQALPTSPWVAVRAGYSWLLSTASLAKAVTEGCDLRHTHAARQERANRAQRQKGLRNQPYSPSLLALLRAHAGV